jgi:hypothetical protein
VTFRFDCRNDVVFLLTLHCNWIWTAAAFPPPPPPPQTLRWLLRYERVSWQLHPKRCTNCWYIISVRRGGWGEGGAKSFSRSDQLLLPFEETGPQNTSSRPDQSETWWSNSLGCSENQSVARTVCITFFHLLIIILLYRHYLFSFIFSFVYPLSSSISYLLFSLRLLHLLVKDIYFLERVLFKASEDPLLRHRWRQVARWLRHSVSGQQMQKHTQGHCVLNSESSSYTDATAIAPYSGDI